MRRVKTGIQNNMKEAVEKIGAKYEQAINAATASLLVELSESLNVIMDTLRKTLNPPPDEVFVSQFEEQVLGVIAQAFQAALTDCVSSLKPPKIRRSNDAFSTAEKNLIEVTVGRFQSWKSDNLKEETGGIAVVLKKPEYRDEVTAILARHLNDARKTLQSL